MTFNKEKIKKFTKKLAVVCVVVFACLAFAIYLLSISVIPKLEAEQKQREIDRKYPEIKQMEEEANRIEQQEKVWQERYKNDAVGGKTPEETLDLLIEALKKEDVELASRYYEVGKQEKALAKFKENLKKEGNLNKSIEYYSLLRKEGKKTCNDLTGRLGGCNFEYVYITEKDETVEFGTLGDKLFLPKGSERRKSVDLQLNQYTKIWKIED